MIRQFVDQGRAFLEIDTSASSFGRNVAVLTGGTVGAHIIAGLASPIVSRLYTPEHFGMFGVFASLLGILFVVSDLSFGWAIPIPHSDRVAVNVLIVSVAIVTAVSLLTAVLVWLTGDVVLHWSNASAMGPYLWLLSAAVMAAGLYEVFTHWAVRMSAYRDIAHAKVRLSVARVVTLLSLGVLRVGVVGLILGEIVGRLVSVWTLASLAWSRGRHLTSQASARGSWLAARRYWRFPLFSGPAALLHSLHTLLPVLIFAALYGPQVAGWFTFVQRIIWAPISLIPEAVGRVYYGEASQLARHNPDELNRLFRIIIARSFRITVLPILALMITAPQLFAFVFGASWHEAGRYMQILGATFIVKIVVGPVFHTLNILERQSWLLASESAGGILILGGLLGVHQLGWPADRAVMVYAGVVIVVYAVLFVLTKTAIQQRLRQGASVVG